MNHCKECGAELAPDASFCTQCGTRVEPIEPDFTSPPQVEEDLAAVADELDLSEKVEAAEPPIQAPPQVQAPPPVQFPPPVQPPPVSRTYPPPPPPPARPAPPYGYGVPPAQPPPQPQPYGYGAQPPPQAQAPPAYGYGYGAPPAQGYPYPAPPPKRKKRWWIPVTIILVILGLLAGAYFVWGDQIMGLFGSTEKKWQKAEAASGLVMEGSLLADVRESLSEGLKETKAGFVTDLTFDIKADALPDEMAEVLTGLSALRFHLEGRTDMNEKDPRFYIKAGIGKRQDTGEALAAEIYDADGYYIFELPRLFNRPLAVDKDYLSDMMEGGGLSIGDIFGSTNGMRQSMGAFSGDQLDRVYEDLKAIFMKYAGKPELTKGALLVVGSVSQKLDYYDVTVQASDFPNMAKEMVTYLKNSKDIKALLLEGVAEEAYEGFIKAMDDALDELEVNRDEARVEVRRKLYVDKKNKPVGSELYLTHYEDGKAETVKLLSHHVEAGGKEAQLILFETPDDTGFQYQSEYSKNKGAYTGTYSVYVKEWDWEGPGKFEEVARGSFSDFSLQKESKKLYPVGKLELELTGLDDGYGDGPERVILKYEGKLEGGHLKAKLEIQVKDEDFPLTLSLGIDHRVLAPSEITFAKQVPPNFLDMSDEDALDELLSDEGIMDRLYQILEELGIDPELLGGLSGNDWDDEWDWDD